MCKPSTHRQFIKVTQCRPYTSLIDSHESVLMVRGGGGGVEGGGEVEGGRLGLADLL